MKKVVSLVTTVVASLLIMIPATVAHAGTTVYNVPTSINSNCTADAWAGLTSFIATVPDGTATNTSTIQFAANTCYLLSAPLVLDGRNYLVFVSGGTKHNGTAGAYTNGTEITTNIVPVCNDQGTDAHIIKLKASAGPSSNIEFDGFNLVGDNPTPGVFYPSQYCQHGIMANNTPGFTAKYLSISNTYGDCIYISDQSGQPTNSAIRYVACTNPGREGFSVLNATEGTGNLSVLITNCTVYDARNGVTMDKNSSGDAAPGVQVVNNNFQQTRNFMLQYVNDSNDAVVTGNTCSNKCGDTVFKAGAINATVTGNTLGSVWLNDVNAVNMNGNTLTECPYGNGDYVKVGNIDVEVPTDSSYVTNNNGTGGHSCHGFQTIQGGTTQNNLTESGNTWS